MGQSAINSIPCFLKIAKQKEQNKQFETIYAKLTKLAKEKQNTH